MKREYICPYCFNRHKMHEVQFACSDEKCLEDDQVYADYWGYHMKRPTITDAPAPGTFAFIKPTMPSQASCRSCSKSTYSRVCPTCHSSLPTTISDYEDYIIAVIGAKQSGKSHYIAVLIDEIINKIGNSYNCYLKPENDETIHRYNRQFRDPIYKRKTALNVTRSAGSDPDVKKPLLFTLTFSGGVMGTKVITLAFFDTAGEDLKDESIMEKHTKYICNSAGVICLLDPLQLPEVRSQVAAANPGVQLPADDPDSDGADILNRTTNLIRNTLRIKASKKIKIPIAVSFSKTDAIGPLLDPTSKLMQPSRHTDTNGFDVEDFHSVNDEMKALVQGWTRGNIPNLLEHHYQTYAYFGLSSLGHSPSHTMQIDEVKPYRVEDPFLWLLWKNGIIKGTERK
ncbi:TRAFAC clade GTPase domain-containing protein [Cytobacillus firmus]|uniref:TRAFAC clade GTPase domain-containing protein n=1 Tax=Cytobacillus firmus TaxID=1399 RepID=UPI0024947988|nr:hypothetical protein [Cytobacillus firmus]